MKFRQSFVGRLRDWRLRRTSLRVFLWFLLAPALLAEPARTPNIGPGEKKDLLIADNGNVRVGIDREMGASITYLSWTTYRENVVNIHDPGRLIQQSYYAGRVLSPIASVELGPRSKLRYRYWMVVGTEKEIGEAVDVLLEKYGEGRVELVK